MNDDRGFVSVYVLSERCDLVAKILGHFVYFAAIWGKWDKIFERGLFKKIHRVTVLRHMQMSLIFSITHHSDSIFRRNSQ